MENRSDIIAILALLISIIGVSIQFRDYLIGSQVKLIEPDQLIFVENEIDGNQLIDVVVRVVYLNSGAPGYPQEILNESAVIAIGGSIFRFKALHMVSPQRILGKVKYVEKKDFLPFQVKGKSIKSHYTQFVPTRLNKDDQLLTRNTLLRLAAAEEKIKFSIHYRHLSGSSDSVSCVAMSYEVLSGLAEEESVTVKCLRRKAGGLRKRRH